MGRHANYSRRGFFKLCTAAVPLIAANPRLLAQNSGKSRRYNRVQLVDGLGQPVRCEQLRADENYLFHYPFVSTPCFLINMEKAEIKPTQLETQSGDGYEWRGGVGPQRGVVAFSAICAHRMSHPARAVSFIRYRKDPASFVQSNQQRTSRSRVIYCCSEKSVYDPAQGARVLAGPAPQPLAAIELEEDAAGNLYAVGTIGGEMFEQYFDKFSNRLILEYKTTEPARLLSGNTTVTLLQEHSRYLVNC